MLDAVDVDNALDAEFLVNGPAARGALLAAAGQLRGYPLLVTVKIWCSDGALAQALVQLTQEGCKVVQLTSMAS